MLQRFTSKHVCSVTIVAAGTVLHTVFGGLWRHMAISTLVMQQCMLCGRLHRLLWGDPNCSPMCSDQSVGLQQNLCMLATAVPASKPPKTFHVQLDC